MAGGRHDGRWARNEPPRTEATRPTPFGAEPDPQPGAAVAGTYRPSKPASAGRGHHAIRAHSTAARDRVTRDAPYSRGLAVTVPDAPSFSGRARSAGRGS